MEENKLQENSAAIAGSAAPAPEFKRTGKRHRLGRRAILAIVWTAVVVGSAGLALAANVLLARQGEIYSDKASVSAVIVDLVAAGKLTELDVKVGDLVRKNQVIGTVESVPVKSKIDGLVVAVSDKIGEAVTPANPVASIADLKDTWIEVKVDEGKVAPIQVGERAWFVADAYPRDRIQAVVSEIAPQSASGGIVFSISDKRETKQFVVKLRYDQSKFPRLRPGMSAKAWIAIK
jgi:multidrug resistance efflux pump